MAAIQHRGKQQNKNRGKAQQKTKPPPLPPRPQGGQWSTDSAPSTVAREATGLCFYHWSFGEKAHSCQAPCSWQGN